MQSDSYVDTIYGGSGADTFMIDATRSTADNLADYSVADNDVIDISNVISYDPGLGDLIDDFVKLVDSGDGDPANGSGTVTMMVDADGAANGVNFQNYFTFDDQGMVLDDLISNGHLLV